MLPLIRADQEIITNSDLHAVVSILAVVCLVFGIISAFGRVFTKIAVVQSLALDDYVIFPSLVCLIFVQIEFLLMTAFRSCILGRLLRFCRHLGMDWENIGVR